MSKWDEESELPEIGELVVATVKEIKRFGAYLYLDDYDIDAYLPISEVSSRWVRNISDVIKVDQKIVVKVLRVDYRNRTVDVSLKEVSKREGERVLRKWKRDQRGIQIISEMVDALELDESVVEEKISPLIEREPSVYDALEKIVIEPKLLDELTFKNEKREILEFLSKRIKPRVYLYEVRFQAYSIEKNGIGILKSTLEDIEKRILDEAKDIKLELFNDGTPRYRIRVRSYKPEIIKRKVMPLIRDLEREYGKKLNVKILEERTRVET